MQPPESLPVSASAVSPGDRAPQAFGGASGSGSRLVIGLLALGVAAGVAGILFQRGQTRRCLEFYGAEAARKVAAAPVVEVWSLRPGAGPGGLVAVERRDVSTARGLVHLRRGLVEDANFLWPAPGRDATSRLHESAWDTALAFSDPADGRPPVMLVMDLDGAATAPGEVGEEGALAVVGRPGRITLGRIAGGLATWLREVH